MEARWLGLALATVMIVVGTVGCAAVDDEEEAEPSASSSDELAIGTTLRCGIGCPAGTHDVGPACVSTCGGCNPYGRNATYCSSQRPASKVVCGHGCPAGYVAQAPLCISTCGGCSPYGRNATQCVRATSSGGNSRGVSSSVTCGFACPIGLHLEKRLCISTCGGCNPYGSNAVECAR